MLAPCIHYLLDRNSFLVPRLEGWKPRAWRPSLQSTLGNRTRDVLREKSSLGRKIRQHGFPELGNQIARRSPLEIFFVHRCMSLNRAQNKAAVLFFQLEAVKSQESTERPAKKEFQ